MGPAKLAFVILVAVYPIVVYFGLAHFDVRTVAAMLFVIGLVRLLIIRRGVNGGMGAKQSLLVIGGLLTVSALVYATNRPDLLRYYPVLVNVAFFTVFFGSLVFPPTVVERIARRQNPNLSPAGIRYTRIVTMVWCAFFVGNGAMALYTSLQAGLGAWAAYNGAISYCIMGILFAGEYVIRGRLRLDGPEMPTPQSHR